MTSQPVLETPKCENGNLQFRCLIPFDSQDNKANFNVTWMVDGKPIIDFRTHQPIIQTLTNGQRIATLNAYKLARNMGKRVNKRVIIKISIVHANNFLRRIFVHDIRLISSKKFHFKVSKIFDKYH